MVKKTNPITKCLMMVIGISVSMLIGGCEVGGGKQKTQKASFISDRASADTAVETLKTVSAHELNLEQQNQKLVEQNNALIAQDKTTLTQLKSDVLTEVQKQIQQLKAEQQANHSVGLPAHDQSEAKIPQTFDAEGNPITSDKGFVWVSDLQEMNQTDATNKGGSSKDKASTKANLAALLNPTIEEQNKQNKQKSNGNSLNKSMDSIIPSDLSIDDDNGQAKSKIKTIPYYTIPVNATLTGAIAMQPLIGRVPIDGKVPDPYSFKAIIGPKNLSANGIDIPSDIQGIVASGIAEGDMLGGCVRGVITSMTFVFADGRISTTQAKSSEGLGTIAAANGNPCIAGSFHSDAAIFLGATAALAGLQGYGNALSQAQLSTTTSQTTGIPISTLIGSANKYAFGQGFSASSQAAQQWWNQRVQNSFDFVYVPNVDPQTGKKLELNINITQEIPIDYNSKGRKVFYDHTNNSYATEKLD